MKNKTTIKKQNAARQTATLKKIDAEHAACPSTIPRRAILLLPPRAVCDAAAAHTYDNKKAAANLIKDKAVKRDAMTAAAIEYMDALADNDAYTGLRYDDTIISRILAARAARDTAAYYDTANLVMGIAAAAAASVMRTIYKDNGNSLYRVKKYSDACGAYYWTTATLNNEIFNSLTDAAAATLWECGSIAAARKAAASEQYHVYRKPYMQEEPAVIARRRAARIESDADKLKGNKGVRGIFKSAVDCLNATGVKDIYRDVFAMYANGATTENIAATIYGVTITDNNAAKYRGRICRIARNVERILYRNAGIQVELSQHYNRITTAELARAKAFTAAVHAAAPAERHCLINEHSGRRKAATKVK